jgi:hypothetical protein
VSGQWDYARILTRIESRVTSVERRLRDAIGSAIKFFIDLEDVKARTDEHAPLVEGQVWGINADEEWDIITPAAPGAGLYATMSLTGLYDGSTISGVSSEWQVWSTGYDLSAVTAPDAGLYGIGVTEPGIYLATAAVVVTSGSGYPTVTLTMSSAGAGKWSTTGDEDDCRDPLVALDDASGGGAVSLLLPLDDTLTAAIDIAMDTATEVRWRLQVAWQAPAAVIPGPCAT